MRVLKAILLILVLGVGAVVGTSSLMGHHTEYCPWSHVLLTTEDCVVRDRLAGMVLIEHHDADNVYNRNNYLEIRNGSQSSRFRMPTAGRLTLECSLQLIRNDHGALLLNGRRTDLKPL